MERVAMKTGKIKERVEGIKDIKPVTKSTRPKTGDLFRCLLSCKKENKWISEFHVRQHLDNQVHDCLNYDMQNSLDRHLSSMYVT